MFDRLFRTLPVRPPDRLARAILHHGLRVENDPDKSPEAVIREMGQFLAGFLAIVVLVQLLAELWR